MAGSYDGSIRIDTSINAVPIDKGIAQIENKIKGLAATIGLAFGVKELIDFGKRSIDAASDLAEAQNVVDTAFGDMSYKMEQFAATALDTYGISELTAKNMGSTYMAMAKGMGVATDAASDMAVTLTGRLSDIMSFYNKTQSEVDTIGRALITGETEPLKAIGVVMTQTNLSAYAMAQGFSKTYTEMSSNEQLLVRYKYFLEQTSLAQGDFAKTSEGWANQTRLLSERFNEFATNFGNIIMNVLTPALQFANEGVSFLNDLFFGGNSNVEDTTAVKNAEAVTDEVTSMGAAADKSKKKLNNLLSGFDELHVISGAGSDKDKENTTDSGIDTSNLLGENLDADTSTAKKAAQKYRDIINEIYLAFKRHPLTKTIEGIIGAIGKFFGFIKGNKDISAGDIVDTLMDILGAILAYKALSGIVGGVKAFAGGFSSLISLITAHPVVAAIAGITALTIGIIALSEEMEHQRIASYFGDISISLEEIDELVSPITEDVDNVAQAFEDNKDKLTTAKENFSEIAKAVQETADSFKNNDIEQDVEGFAKQLDELVTSALEVNSATFDTSALEQAFLLGDGVIDEEQQEILDKLNAIGGSVADKIKQYGEDIHKITDTVIKEKRDLTEAEIENLKTLYQELADMTRQQEDIKTQATWERLKDGAYTFDSYDELMDQIQKAREQAEASREAIEQSGYETLMESKAAALASGKYSEAELDKLVEDGKKAIEESLEEEEIKNKRDERDVILGWMQGAVGNVVKSYSGVTDDDIAEIQRYFQLMLSNPDGIMDRASMGELFRGINDMDAASNLDNTFRALEDIEKQFGFDFVDKWAELNDEIGDTGYTLDDFFDTYNQAIDEMTMLDVDDIIPSLEELKETPEEYAKYMSAWAAAQSYSVTIEGDFDEEGFERRFNNFLSQKGLKPLQFQPSNYVSTSTLQQSNSNTNIQLNVNIDEGNRTVTASDGVTTNTTWKKDNMMDNGGGG